MKKLCLKRWLVIFIFFSHQIAFSQTNHPVISQLFGSGGTSPSLPNYDFIELYNPSASAVNLSGWSVQLAFGAATTYTTIALSGSMPGYCYYLIQLSRDNYVTGTALPTPDLVYNFNINAPDIKVGLVSSTTAISGANPSASCIDFVGTGIADGFEGPGPAPQGSASVSLLRKSSVTSTAASTANNGSEYTNGNGWDTDNNTQDFVLQSSVSARGSMMGSTLPITFLSFSIENKGTNVLLCWQVDGEKEINYYEIEKSAEGISFLSLCKMTATLSAKYQYADAITSAPCYYRIKSVYHNKKFNYSSVVYHRGQPGLTIRILPTLANNELVIQHPISTPKDQILIYSKGGHLVQKIIPIRGQQQTLVSVFYLKPGMYFIQYANGRGDKFIGQFVKGY